MKYRIAIFTSDWNYNLVTQFYDGLYRFLDEQHEVTVFVFDCFAGKAEEGDAGYSEFQIFNLPDLHDFDGAVIQGNQILSDKLRNQIIAQIPVGRIGEPHEIARAVDFLTADDAGFITGVNLPVNGGSFISF